MFPLRLPVFNTAMMQREREASQKALRYATAETECSVCGGVGLI
jgi:hypothetical protein